MTHLSSRSQELLKFLQVEYIDNGYMYSGSWPYMSLLEQGYSKGDMDTLVAAGLIQKRNCDDLAYELTAPEREKLLREYDLPTRWRENAGKGLISSIEQEIRSVTSGAEQRKPALADIIQSAEKRASGDVDNFITLTANEDRTWSAVVSPENASGKSVLLAREQAYPVQVIYRRTDINGSGVVDQVVCKNREDLVQSLNWMGKCGFVPLEMWDFDIDTTTNESLLKMFNDGELRRFEQIERELDELSAAMDDDFDVPTHRNSEDLER